MNLNRSQARRILGFALMAAMTAASSFPAAGAVVEGRTGQDRRYIVGGIGLDESGQMKASARDFALAITVAATSGAYLADSRIRIVGARGEVVLEEKLEAPYLLVDLAPGTYKVEATVRGKRQTRSVEITANVPSSIVFSFDVPVDRVPEGAPVR